MIALHKALVYLALGLLALLMVALVRQGKVKQSFLFSTYVSCVVLFNVLILLFPDSYTPEAYMVKQGIYDSLLFGMSLELSIRTFAAFTGIARMVRVVLASAVALSTLGILIATPGNPDYQSFIGVQAGITTAGIWCLAFVGLLIVWYQIPVPAFTRAIILGYVPYLMVFTVYTDLLARLGWGAISNLNVMNAAAYDAVAGYWAFAAWRKD